MTVLDDCAMQSGFVVFVVVVEVPLTQNHTDVRRRDIMEMTDIEEAGKKEKKEGKTLINTWVDTQSALTDFCVSLSFSLLSCLPRTLLRTWIKDLLFKDELLSPSVTSYSSSWSSHSVEERFSPADEIFIWFHSGKRRGRRWSNSSSSSISLEDHESIKAWDERIGKEKHGETYQPRRVENNWKLSVTACPAWSWP